MANLDVIVVPGIATIEHEGSSWYVTLAGERFTNLDRKFPSLISALAFVEAYNG